MELDKNNLEEMLQESLVLHLDHPKDEILRDTFNNLQLVYREVHGSFYKPVFESDLIPIDYEDTRKHVRGYN